MSTKIKGVLISLISIFKFSKKKAVKPLKDAVRFPNALTKHVVEDFEVAAYHNQA